MEIKIVRDKISQEELLKIAKEGFGGMLKAVVDVEKGVMAVGGGMHADAEAVLLNNGSMQDNLWGINILPGRDIDGMIEFESLINIRPRENNRSMEIQDQGLKEKIRRIVNKLIGL